MYKSIFKWLLVILWMVVIFSFSSQKSYESDNSSHNVIKVIVKFTNKVHLTNYSVNDIDSINNSLNKPVRKLAHFSEYFILALLLFNAMGFSKKNILYVILICFIYSLSDEAHQLFLSGRNGSFIDTLIDTSGAVVCSLLCKLKNMQ